MREKGRIFACLDVSFHWALSPNSLGLIRTCSSSLVHMSFAVKPDF
jgi:hypothetical protein